MSNLNCKDSKLETTADNTMINFNWNIINDEIQHKSFFFRKVDVPGLSVVSRQKVFFDVV